MKQKIPASLVTAGHPDFADLNAIAQDITRRAGGPEALKKRIPQMLRSCIDDVILTAKTGRRAYEELEKTEKTYIGTRVEIELRALLALQKGRLDTEILGQDVDIKHTMGTNWMIPTEATDQICILVAADEVRAQCYLGLIRARGAYLTSGQNKDAKRSLSARGFAHILWMLSAAPYPANFWRGLPADQVVRIFAPRSGTARITALFRELQDRPIDRSVVEAVAQQSDFMRRIRADNGRGARDRLAAEGIALLSGQYDSTEIAALGLGEIPSDAFISHAGSPPKRSAGELFDVTDLAQNRLL